jgi:tight adherence protein B
MSTPTLIIACVFVAAVLITLVAMLGLASGVGAYHRAVIATSQSHLSDAFIAVGRHQIIAMTVGGTLGLSVLGYLALGVPGVILGSFAGLVAPRMFKRYLIQRREAEFVYQLPDALRTMSGALRSGGNVVRALEQVAQRQPKPICQEFQLVLQQYQLGRDLNEALLDLEKRMNCEELQLLTAAITLSRTVGGNLGDSLEALAHTLQKKAQVEGKIKSMTATGRAQSYMMSMLPIAVGIMLNMQEPAAMGKLFNTIYGWATVLLIAVMIGIGFLTIRKIVDIDV